MFYETNSRNVIMRANGELCYASGMKFISEWQRAITWSFNAYRAAESLLHGTFHLILKVCHY